MYMHTKNIATCITRTVTIPQYPHDIRHTLASQDASPLLKHAWSVTITQPCEISI